MGWFYRGRDDTFSRDVWIKTLSQTAADLGSGSPIQWSMADSRARFVREARVIPKLEHPNIIIMYELGEHESRPFIALEGLEGQRLLDAMNAGISLEAGLPIILQVLDGLLYMHSRSIIHMGITPANIFICTGGRAKVIDFSIARVVGPDQCLADTGQIIGTPHYMSSEQAQGDRIDHRSDLFSVGSVLYEMVAGRKAFDGDTPIAVLFKIIQDNPDMELISEGLEWKRLRDVITHALQKKPVDRYQDAGAMRADVELALKELGESADVITPVRRQTNVAEHFESREPCQEPPSERTQHEPLHGESWEAKETVTPPLPPSRRHCILCERAVDPDGAPFGPRLDPRLRLANGIVCSECKARRPQGTD